MSDETQFCDHCGDQLQENERFVVESLDADIASANEGESAVLCDECYRAHQETPRLLEMFDRVSYE